MEKKKRFLVILMIFPTAGNNEKKKRKKNFNLNIFGANLEWATAHLYCKKNIVLQLSEKWVGIVLQPGRKVY